MPVDQNDPEVKAALKAAADAARTELSDSIAKLEENNARLTAQLRDLRKGQGDTVPLEKYQALEDQLTETKGHLTKAQKDLTTATDKFTANEKALTEKLNGEKGFTTRLLKDNGLTEQLVKAGVDAKYLPAVRALLKDRVQIVEEGEDRKAVADGKALDAFITDWKGTDEGKSFITATPSSGTGAAGSQQQQGITTINPADKTAFQSNLEGIANGTVKIAVPGA